MKRVLLDENVPHKLRLSLARNEVTTVAYGGWSGLKNGELLSAAEREGFDVFLTGDRGLEYQQNLANRKIAIVWLSTNNWPILKKHVARVAAAVEGARPGTFARVDCGLFARKPPRPGTS
jgi:putative NIF3 family GTP cyclohydrolase 1 type 2